MENVEIANSLREVGDLLEILGANPFRVRAYRNAIRTVVEHTTPMKKLVEEGADLTDLPSIGKGMADNIVELVETGELSVIDDLIEELKQKRDELRVQINLASREIKDEWEDLEEKMDDFADKAKELSSEAGLRETGEGIANALGQLGQELKLGYERIRNALKDD